MDSCQDSIENCSICRNSRKNNFPIAPNNYQQIFGYIGPANSYINGSKASLKKVRRKVSSKLFYPKNLDLRRDKSQNWKIPGMCLYNFKCDDTKMRYDESDTDFNSVRYLNRFRSQKRKKEKINPGLMKSKKSTAGKTKSRAKCKESVASFDSQTTGGAGNCMSIDSLSRMGKRKAYKTDSEDFYPNVSRKPTNNDKNTKTPKKKKFPAICSGISVDSANRYGANRMGMGTSSSSLKMKNLKATVNALGSIESMRKKTGKDCYRPDPEDYGAKIMKRPKDKNVKKPPAAFTDSDFSVNSYEHYGKANKSKGRRKVKKQSSDSSTNISPKKHMKDSFFGSIESMKHYKRIKKKVQPPPPPQKKSCRAPSREDRDDLEDELYARFMYPTRKKSTKRTLSVKRKKKLF